MAGKVRMFAVIAALSASVAFGGVSAGDDKVSIGQASEQAGKWDSGIAMLVNNLTHVELAVPKDLAEKEKVGTELFTGKRAIVDHDTCAVWQEKQSGMSAMMGMFSSKMPEKWDYCYQTYATDPTKNYAGMLGNFSQTWAKEGDKDEYILLVHLPAGKYLLSAWGPLPDDPKNNYMTFTDSSVMPVIEVKEHEITLVGEFKNDKPKRDSMGMGLMPYLQSYKLYTSADDKKKILETMKARLDVQAKDAKYNEKRAERWKKWLPEIEAATAKVQ